MSNKDSNNSRNSRVIQRVHYYVLYALSSSSNIGTDDRSLLGRILTIISSGVARGGWKTPHRKCQKKISEEKIVENTQS